MFSGRLSDEQDFCVLKQISRHSLLSDTQVKLDDRFRASRDAHVTDTTNTPKLVGHLRWRLTLTEYLAGTHLDIYP